MTRRILIATMCVVGGIATVAEAKFPRKEFGKAKGGPYEWTAGNGLDYVYRLPKRYNPKTGATLTFVLHGSNLSRHWGFANHRPNSFRPDDIVVSPDGTTPNGRGGFNFLGKPADLERLHALHGELKAALKIRATLIYGHSQGSFFAFHYAGAYPEEVQGIVGHASGVWNWTKQPNEARKQAIVLLHGTQDPVIPYFQSVGGYTSFRDAGYPVVRLRSLEGWNHWPAEHNGPVPHTSQQLAWCEGMTTTDLERLGASFSVLLAVKDKTKHDFEATHTLAQRIAKTEGAPAKLRKRAAKAIQAIDKLVSAHVSALKKSIGKNRRGAFDGKEWAGHLPLFLRAFSGTPRADEFAKKLSKVLERHKKDAIAHLRAHYDANRSGDERKAFDEGISAIEKGFLHHECEDRKFLERMAKWREEADDLGISRESAKRYDKFVVAFTAALKKGRRTFDGLNRKVARF